MIENEKRRPGGDGAELFDLRLAVGKSILNSKKPKQIIRPVQVSSALNELVRQMVKEHSCSGCEKVFSISEKRSLLVRRRGAL
jgi:hypothetical protein